jgi:hypothetical protein
VSATDHSDAYTVVWVFLGGGLALAGGAAGIAARYWWRAQAGLVAEARVVAVHDTWDSEGDPAFKSEFAFRDRRGRHHRVISSWACKPARHKVGDRIHVSYPADQPERAEVLITSRWLVVMAAAGLFLMAIAWLFYRGLATGRLTDGD